MPRFAANPALTEQLRVVNRVYRRQNLRKWFGAASNRAIVAAGVLWYGDSYGEGTGSTGIGYRAVDRMKAYLTQLLPTAGVANVAASNYVPGWIRSGGFTPYTEIGSVTHFNGYATLGIRTTGTQAVGAGLSWTMTGSRFFLDFKRVPGAPTSTIDVKVDGVSVSGSPFNSDWSFPNDFGTVDSGLLSDGVHTIEATQAGANMVYIAGLRCYRDEYAKGIHTYDAGYSGYTANLLAGGGSYDQAVYFGLPNQLVLIALSLNDVVFNDDEFTWAAGIKNIIANRRSKGGNNASFLIVLFPMRGDTGTAATLSRYIELARRYLNQAKKIADADNDVAVLDMTYIVPACSMLGVSPNDDLGYFGADKIHPPDSGHDRIGRDLAYAVCP